MVSMIWSISYGGSRYFKFQDKTDLNINLQTTPGFLCILMVVFFIELIREMMSIARDFHACHLKMKTKLKIFFQLKFEKTEKSDQCI